jgi:hypothetical protein
MSSINMRIHQIIQQIINAEARVSNSRMPDHVRARDYLNQAKSLLYLAVADDGKD